MAGLEAIQISWPGLREFRFNGWRKFRFNGRTGGNSDVVARTAEKNINSDLMARAGGNSDLVARAADKKINSDFVARGPSDLVAGLEEIQI